MFYSLAMAERIEHWFNRRYGPARRDVYLIRTPTGWQTLGREGGSDGREVSHYFDDEAGARRMVKAMLDTVPAESSNWAPDAAEAAAVSLTAAIATLEQVLGENGISFV